MTSTSSAADTALPSRRNLIAQAGVLASITAAGATMVMPAAADTPGPIERMYLEHVRLAGIYNATFDTEWDAEKRYVEPERPKWSPWTAEGGYRLEPLPNNKCRCYLDDRDENIARLREMISKEHEPDVEDQGYWNADRASRARKTLGEIEAWKAEAQRRSDAAGLTAARKAKTDAKAAAEDHANQVFAIEPTTFRELAFRAAVLMHTWDEEVAEMLPEQLVDLAAVDPHPLS